MIEAFYERTPRGFTPTDYVTGPWDSDLSHAGPPAALLLNEIARSVEGMGISRVSYEIPRGIPRVPYRTHVDVLRPGRRVKLLRADLRDPDDAVLMSATAWCIRETTGLPIGDAHPMDLPDVAACPTLALRFLDGIGYLDGVEMRIAEGAPFGAQGPAAIWIRQVIPLIEGEDADPYARCGMFGDLGNGISALAPFEELLAVNTDLTLYLARRPTSDWMAMRSVTITRGMGLGISDSLVYDASGFVARANQSIYFDRR
jgi:hypothetical protein